MCVSPLHRQTRRTSHCRSGPDPVDLKLPADVVLHTAGNLYMAVSMYTGGGFTVICFVVAVMCGVNWCALVIEDF